MNIFLNLFNINLDAPHAWGIYFQDSATPQMEGLVELHDNIMFYLVAILFAVGWVLLSIVRNYVDTKNPISHKYLNHGIVSVPAQKCSNYNLYDYFLNLKSLRDKRSDPSLGITSNEMMVILRIRGNLFSVGNLWKVRSYSTFSPNNNKKSSDDQIVPVVIYEDAFTMKKTILKENKGKSGIYMLTNKLTGDIYVGQSVDLSKRFSNYFNLSYINRRNELIICRALIKYGYCNFSVTILEYCDKSDLDIREQHYFDTLNPQYNIQKIAGGSSLGLILSEETKNKISKALKGVYVGEKSYWFGRTMSPATREIMSSKRKGKLNPLYGKSHSEESKELMRQKASASLAGRKYSEETKLLMSSKRGNPVNIYEKCTEEGFKLIGSFVSARRAGKFLDISGSTIIKYIKSGAVFKDRYKFSSK